MQQHRGEYEYIVIGSGAGGGTVAARLAENGARVLILEAGSDPLGECKPDVGASDDDRLVHDYKVPAFNAFASESDAIKWDFFVRHYESEERQEKDLKYKERWNERSDSDGVLYPRAGCLGGCTAHNAMITVYPHNDDWEHIRKLTCDPSWSAKSMRRYFQRLEDCRHRPLMRFLSKFGYNPSRHGWKGWLRTEMAMPMSALDDKGLVEVLRDVAQEALSEKRGLLQRLGWEIISRGDPNDWRLVKDDAVGVRYQPLATKDHVRVGSRERVMDVMRRYPDKLSVKLNCLVTRVLFDADNRAVGVEYQEGPRLYRAHAKSSETDGEIKEVYASREVILSGGAFNTPQILMLSGVGPADELEKFNIPVRVDLPGVGSNLQDRYEVGVVNRMNFDCWKVLECATFDDQDPQFNDWKHRREGVYTTNGAVLSVIRRSTPDKDLPDLFCFALLGDFHGYFPGFSEELKKKKNYLTWAILKAHTNNTAGTVRLRSNNPRDTPLIDFKYFDEGNDAQEEDVRSVVEGIKFVRELAEPLIADGWIVEEEVPGEKFPSDPDLTEFVKDNAWGHHASCSCPIGDRDKGGVVNGDFEVHGTRGLRVVDASVFPKIPGFFIVSSVYTIGEKAADVILASADR